MAGSRRRARPVAAARLCLAGWLSIYDEGESLVKIFCAISGFNRENDGYGGCITGGWLSPKLWRKYFETIPKWREMKIRRKPTGGWLKYHGGENGLKSAYHLFNAAENIGGSRSGGMAMAKKLSESWKLYSAQILKWLAMYWLKYRSMAEASVARLYRNALSCVWLCVCVCLWQMAGCLLFWKR